MTSEPVEQIEPRLDIQEDIRYQETGWTIQRIASYLILALAIPIGLGLFGNGPLSEKKVQQGRVTLSYERFLHHLGNTEADFFLERPDSITTIVFPRAYLAHFTIESMLPEPLDSHLSGDGVVYRFRTKGPGHIRFQVLAVETGSYRGEVRVDGEKLGVFQFTYP